VAHEFFDPAWVRNGKFDLSGDERPTRTVQVRLALQACEKRDFKLIPLERREHTSTYYLREGDRPFLEAQYYMSLDRACRTLSLGLSIEKANEKSMDRKEWDWARLVALGREGLVARLTAASNKLVRPVALVIESHEVHGEQETDEPRETVPFVLDGDHWLIRAVRVTPKHVFDYLREIDGREDWWADVWIVADFTEEEVSTMRPGDVAKNLHAFHPLRETLRGR
jgi:hypothetical protein